VQRFDLSQGDAATPRFKPKASIAMMSSPGVEMEGITQKERILLKT